MLHTDNPDFFYGILACWAVNKYNGFVSVPLRTLNIGEDQFTRRLTEPLRFIDFARAKEASKRTKYVKAVTRLSEIDEDNMHRAFFFESFRGVDTGYRVVC